MVAQRSWSCQSCRGTVIADNSWTVTCLQCGAQYDGSGHRLRDDWADNPSVYDEEIGDMEGYEIEQARKGDT